MVMAGLERADQGTVIVAGEELGALNEDALARFRGRNVGIRSSGWKQALQAFTIHFDGRIPTP